MHLCIQSELSGLWLPTCHLCTHSGRIQWLPWGPEVGIRFRFPILGHFSHQGDIYLGASLVLQSFDEKKRRPHPNFGWQFIHRCLKNSNKPWAVGPALSLDASLEWRICQETATPPRSGVAVELAVLVFRGDGAFWKQRMRPKMSQISSGESWKWIKMGTLW